MDTSYVVEVELARVGDVRGEQGDRVFTHHRVNLDDERRVPRAGQSLGDPVSAPGGGREARPERRVVERDLTPAPTYMRDGDPPRPVGPQKGRPGDAEVEYPRENLCREDGDRNEHIAAREYGEDKTLRSVDVLVDCGEGCRARLGGLGGGVELVQLAFEAREHA